MISAIGFIAYKKVPRLVMDTASQNKNDTWTICVYLVASDLEDFGEDELSTVVDYQIAEAKAQMSAESEYNQKNRFDTFSSDLKGNKLDLPAYLYYPVKRTATASRKSGETQQTDRPGAASTDIGEMTEDPTMSPAKVGRHIADSYMDYYMTQNVNMGWLFSHALTFSVLDAGKCEDLYKAWCDLSRKQLVDATKNNSVLAEIGRCSDKSTHYAPQDYTVYNTIDMGNYVDNMADTYPEESSRIKKLIKEAVIYHRENGALSDSNGISAYVPGSVEDFSGLMMCLKYIYDICDDPATQALYYYKISGCLNEDMQTYLATTRTQADS